MISELEKLREKKCDGPCRSTLPDAEAEPGLGDAVLTFFFFNHFE